MGSEKKIFVALLAVALLATVGCSRNKQQVAPAPVATGYAAPVSQPVVAATAPAPVRRTSTYIK